MKKPIFVIVCLLALLILVGCTKAVENTVPETAAAETVGTDTSYIDLTLNDFHFIQAEVEGGEYAELSAYALEAPPVSAEEALAIFAPEDTGDYAAEETSEGRSVTTQQGNRCFIGSYYSIRFYKTEEMQLNNEICSLLSLYAQENGENAWRDLDFIDRDSAVAQVEALLDALGVNLEPVLSESAALSAQDIMAYQQKLIEQDAALEEKRYDPFGKAYLLENLDESSDACYLTFTFAYQGVPIFNGSPTVSYISGVLPPYPATLSVLITREGLQCFDGLMLRHVGEVSQSGQILTAAEAAECYRQKYDLAISTDEYAKRVTSIYLEYLPIEQDAGMVLTPYWCFPMETEYPSGWYDSGAERFNAFTGKDLTYGG